MNIVAEHNLPIAADYFGRLYARFNGDLTSLHDKIGALVENQTRNRIARQKASPDGGKWQSLKPATVAAKIRRNTAGGGILRDSNALYESITHEAHTDYALVGAGTKWAGVHQFGWDEKNIPARPYLGLSDTDKREVQTEIVRVIKGWLR